jgi:translation initiation factor 2B subunit (eIF-2B alpha/beta/delta family)
MVGRIKINSQADGVRHLFMALEQDAKKIKECWFCGSKLPQTKRANQGYLTENHAASCSLEELARACEQCIAVREDDEATKQAAENMLAESINDLFGMMEDVTLPISNL